MCTLKVLSVSLVCNQVTRRPCWLTKHNTFFSTGFAWERSLVPSGGKHFCNMSAVTSVKSALAYAIRVNPIVMSAAVWYLIAHKCANICARGNILTIKFRTSEIIAEWLFVSSREVERLLYLLLWYFRLKSINAFVRPFYHFEVDYALLLLALSRIIILFGMSSTVRVKPLNICLCTSLQQKPERRQTVK